MFAATTAAFLLLANAHALASEPSSTTECQSNDKKAEKLEKLLDKRVEAYKRFEDRSSLPAAIEITEALVLTLGVLSSGVGVGAQVAASDNSLLYTSAYACGGCSLVTASILHLLNESLFDHRQEDTAAIQEADSKFKTEAMKF
jgi:hypothetical protein